MPFFCPTPPTPPIPKFWPTLPILKFYGTTSPTPIFQPTPPTTPTPKFYRPTLPTPSTPNFEQCHPRTLASTLPTPPTNTRYLHHPRYLADFFCIFQCFEDSSPDSLESSALFSGVPQFLSNCATLFLIENRYFVLYYILKKAFALKGTVMQVIQ